MNGLKIYLIMILNPITQKWMGCEYITLMKVRRRVKSFYCCMENRVGHFYTGT